MLFKGRVTLVFLMLLKSCTFALEKQSFMKKYIRKKERIFFLLFECSQFIMSQGNE